MENKRRREIALAATAVVVLAFAVLAYRVKTMEPPPSVPTQASRPPVPGTQSASSGASTTPNGLTELNLQALNAPHGEIQTTVRDPFRFKPKPPPPPPPPPPPVVRPVTQPTGPVGPPPPPRITLKFIGYLDIPGKGPYAALRDDRGVYRGFAGDTIEGRYKILRIGVESLDIAYLDGRGKQTIRLTGQ
jgi:hypothetical protein